MTDAETFEMDDVQASRAPEVTLVLARAEPSVDHTLGGRPERQATRSRRKRCPYLVLCAEAPCFVAEAVVGRPRNAALVLRLLVTRHADAVNRSILTLPGLTLTDATVGVLMT